VKIVKIAKSMLTNAIYSEEFLGKTKLSNHTPVCRIILEPQGHNVNIMIGITIILAIVTMI
jgi:hypothetical protein